MSFGIAHTPGPDCKGCCCSGPTECSRKDCDGYVHREVVDEVQIGDDWEWVHDYQCDKCKAKQGDTEMDFEDV